MADVSVDELRLQGMIGLRGDPVALSGACGLPLPGCGRICSDGDRTLAWMSPDELLLMLPHASVESTLSMLSNALMGQHYMAIDISDARATFALTGPGAREVLAKLSPADLHPDSFGPGQFRRTRLGQVAAAFWQVSDDAFQVICFRSVADYMAALLTQSAKDGRVGHFG
jgi:sarcosine oxidase, subunit gamma